MPALAVALVDDDQSVRRQAITSLGRLGSAAALAIPSLRHAALDTDTGVRTLANTLLAQLTPTAVRMAG